MELRPLPLGYVGGCGWGNLFQRAWNTKIQQNNVFNKNYTDKDVFHLAADHIINDYEFS